jgi:hypothetical protein
MREKTKRMAKGKTREQKLRMAIRRTEEQAVNSGNRQNWRTERMDNDKRTGAHVGRMMTIRTRKHTDTMTIGKKRAIL